MKQYKIFTDPQGRMEAVKQGWSWPGFFFTWIWALVKSLYLFGILFLLLTIFLIALRHEIGLVASLLRIIVAIVFGAFGNQWRESNLESRGYDLMDTVSAGTPENAIALYEKQELTKPVSLEQETKKCPACAETIKLEARKCRFCSADLDPEEVARQVASRRAELEEDLAKKKEGKVQCPDCGSWDLRWAVIEGGGMGYWCDNCKKSLDAMGST